MIRRAKPFILIFTFIGLSLSILVGLNASQELSFPHQVVVKFSEGLEVEVSEGQISGKISSVPEPCKLLEAKGLDEEKIEDAFTFLNEILQAPNVLGIEPLFSNEARGLQPEGARPGERNLQLYFSVAFKNVPKDQIEGFIEKLSEFPIIDTAYHAAIPENAGIKPTS